MQATPATACPIREPWPSERRLYPNQLSPNLTTSQPYAVLEKFFGDFCNSDAAAAHIQAHLPTPAPARPAAFLYHIEGCCLFDITDLPAPCKLFWPDPTIPSAGIIRLEYTPHRLYCFNGDAESLFRKCEPLQAVTAVSDSLACGHLISSRRCTLVYPKSSTNVLCASTIETTGSTKPFGFCHFLNGCRQVSASLERCQQQHFVLVQSASDLRDLIAFLILWFCHRRLDYATPQELVQHLCQANLPVSGAEIVQAMKRLVWDMLLHGCTCQVPQGRRWRSKCLLLMTARFLISENRQECLELLHHIWCHDRGRHGLRIGASSTAWVVRSIAFFAASGFLSKRKQETLQKCLLSLNCALLRIPFSSVHSVPRSVGTGLLEVSSYGTIHARSQTATRTWLLEALTSGHALHLKIHLTLCSPVLAHVVAIVRESRRRPEHCQLYIAIPCSN